MANFYLGDKMKKGILGNGNEPMVHSEVRHIRKLGMEKAFGDFLDSAGFDWKSDPNMQNTPHRVAKMYLDELLRGTNSPEPRVTFFPNTKKYDEMIVKDNIRINSLCSHHFMPFSGVCHIGYIPSPKGKVVGLSKLSRITDWFARRPQIQEELTAQIADYLWEKMSPIGVGVIISATHGCVSNRGVMQPGSKMKTSCMTGVFKTKPEARQEFLSLIQMGN